MQWTCISISAGQTQINRNALKKMFQTNSFASQAERERLQHTNEPISFIWKWTKTFLMKTRRPGSGEGGWMDGFLFTSGFSSGFEQLTSLLSHKARWWKCRKANRHTYFTLKTDGLGGNLNPRLRPRIHINERDRQSNICREILYLVFCRTGLLLGAGHDCCMAPRLTTMLRWTRFAFVNDRIFLVSET